MSVVIDRERYWSAEFVDLGPNAARATRSDIERGYRSGGSLDFADDFG